MSVHNAILEGGGLILNWVAEWVCKFWDGL